ncbi:MAG: hypothetical protein ACXAAK_11420 [Candidatus Thorarchaeota archaeon]|jgi:hypothetical protein
MRRIVFGLIILLTLFLIAPSITAHVPISAQDGETLDTAFFIEEPTKSWVIYSELHGDGHPQYFAFEMDAGTRIRMLLSIPVTADPESFTPSIALIGPGIVNSSSIPGDLEIPELSGVMIIESDSATPAYEGFTPTSFYALIDIDMLAPATGEYYFAVYDPAEGGSFSVAIGFVETFTFAEWVLVPFNVVTIHQWNGQNLLSILAPMIATLVLGMVLLIRRKDELKELESGVSWIGAVGALLFFGSGVTIFYQIVLAALFAVDLQIIISILFGMLPILLGVFTIRLVLTENWQKTRSKQIRLLLLGIIAPFLWAGLLVGPALVILSALITIIVSSRENSTKLRKKET